VNCLIGNTLTKRFVRGSTHTLINTLILSGDAGDRRLSGLAAVQEAQGHISHLFEEVGHATEHGDDRDSLSTSLERWKRRSHSAGPVVCLATSSRDS